MKKKLIFILIITTFVLLIAGCSGGDSNSSNPTNQSGQPTNKDKSGAVSAANSQTNSKAVTVTSNTTSEKPKKIEIPRKVKYTKGAIPRKVEHAFDNGTPTLIAFFESKNMLSEKLKPQLEDIMSNYNTSDREGQIRYFAYTDDDSPRVSKLMKAMKVKYLPYVGIIDRNKNLVFEKSGLMENNYLENAIYDAIYDDNQ